MAKVLFLGASQARADAITSRAPSGFEVSYVDRKLSDYEKAPFAGTLMPSLFKAPTYRWSY
jgi:hypothetical protein